MLAEKIASFEKTCLEIEQMSAACGPLISRYLLLKKNIALCGGPLDERLVLNLRKADWPDQYRWMHQKGWTRIIGLEVSWL